MEKKNIYIKLQKVYRKKSDSGRDYEGHTNKHGIAYLDLYEYTA